MTIQPNQVVSSTKSVLINGNNSGQIAVGDGMIVQINTITGGIVNIVPPGQAPLVKPRQTPVMIRPRKIASLLDRKSELAAVLDEVSTGTPVEFFGDHGEGKTALLRALAYHPDLSAFPDGIIYLLGHPQPVEDLLQSLYDAFYETSAPFKPSQAQIRIELASKRALVLLDDLQMDSSQVEALVDTAPNCTFILASTERHLWGEGRALSLPGLPPEDAVQLFRRELGREPSGQEQEPMSHICSLLEGHPLHILQAAALARESEQPLAALASYLSSGNPVEQLNRALLDGLKKEEKNVVAVMTVLGGVPFPGVKLAELANIHRSSPVLENLVQRGLLQTHDAQFGLSGHLGEAAARLWDLDGWRDWVADNLLHMLEKAHDSFVGGSYISAAPAASLAGLINAGLHLLRQAAQQGNWGTVIRMARLLDPLLMMTGRWGCWQQALSLALDAANLLHDRAAGAWAQHQLGTRALGLGDRTAARDLLVRALRQRRLLGDTAGEAATRHNLEFLLGPGPSPRSRGRGGPGRGSGGGLHLARLFLLAGLVLGASLVVAAIVSAYRPPPVFIPPTGATPTRTVMPSALPIQAVTETPLATRTASPTLTATFAPAASDTATSDPTFTASPVPPTPCGPPYGWISYRIQHGDTLYHLATVTGTSVRQVMLANCLNSSLIIAGHLLWLPHLPPAPTFTVEPSPTPTFTPSATWTPSHVPAPDLGISIRLYQVVDGDKNWIFSFSVMVNNTGAGSAQFGASGEITFKALPGHVSHYPNPGQVSWRIVSPIPPGGERSTKVEVFLNKQEWSLQLVAFEASLGDQQSNRETAQLPYYGSGPVATGTVSANPATITPTPVITNGSSK